MKSYKITLLPGDGIGPEITNVTQKILDLVSRKFCFEIKFKEMPFGGAAIDSDGIPSQIELYKNVRTLMLFC